jgi:hypothetical protein
MRAKTHRGHFLEKQMNFAVHLAIIRSRFPAEFALNFARFRSLRNIAVKCDCAVILIATQFLGAACITVAPAGNKTPEINLLASSRSPSSA